jgi:polyhydroxyalkanoate synthase
MTASSEELARGAGALDMLLSDAALGSWRGFVPWTPGLRMTAAIARHPDALRHHGARLVREYGRIATGRSHIAAPPRDRRFAEPAWADNPVLRAVMQAYLVTSDTAQRMVRDVDLPWRDAERVRFAVDNLVEALAPSNVPGLNPLWWKALIDTGGRSVIRGARSLLEDLVQAPRVPTMVDADQFQVGLNVAATPGAVIFRNSVMELIQYAPTTSEVARTPLLIVPPVINKFYIVDLAPGRSLIEYLLASGQQVFTISWRNPDVRHRDWGFDVYGGAVLAAMDATAEITRAAQTHLLSLCSGGALSAMVAAHLADTGHAERIAGFGLAVAVLDQSQAGTAAALADERMARAAVAASRNKGYLDGRSLAEVFAWLRPGDLIWNYWVNNYLQGRRPAAFDILYWNADTTRMTAALHRDFIEVFLANKLSEPRSARMLGSPVDLSAVKSDAYVVAGVADHLCPWQACYRSTQLLGGSSRFVLSSSGHIASLVNPPGNSKASYRVGETTPDPTAWLHSAATESGTWWADYVGWLAERAGGRMSAPSALGNDDYPPLDPAPGTYVYDR